MNINPKEIIDKIKVLASRSFFRDSFWMLVAKVLGMAIQLAYFVLLAKYLRAEYYGIFEGTKAVWAIAFPFVGLGSEHVLVQDVSRSLKVFSQRWGDTLSAFSLSLIIVFFVFFPITIFFLPAVPPLFILLTLIADLVGLKLCVLSESVFIANQQVKEAALYSFFYKSLKLVAVLFLPFFPGNNQLQAWGFLYCLSSVIPAIFLLFLIQVKFGKPIFRSLAFVKDQIKYGFLFSLSESASSINSQMDRAMLTAMSTPRAVGIYSAGYRFIDMFYIPVFAIQGASYPRFFKCGEEGIRGTLRLSRKLFLPGMLYGITSMVILIALAPFVPNILGEEFSQSSSVLIWLSPTPLLYIFQYLAADSLTGAGFQKSRSLVQAGAAVLNVSLNFYLIPIYSWQGAIWATLASEIFRLVFLWLFIAYLYRKTTISNG